MTPEELRAVCKMAGLQRVDGLLVVRWNSEGMPQTYTDDEDPLLLPYVAELLVAKVREYVGTDMEAYEECCGEWMPDGLATAEERIHAAMSVLEQES